MDAWAHMKDLLRQEGRPIEGFGAQFTITRPGVDYDLDQVCDCALRLRDMGATDVSVGGLERGFTSVEQHIDYISEARARLTAALR
jgi:hypothetical protein